MLARQISLHRSSHNEMVRAKDHIGYQPPNEYTRVQRQIKSIESTDIRILSDTTTILGDNTKKGNFEQAAEFLLLAASIRINDMSNNEHHISALNVVTKGLIRLIRFIWSETEVLFIQGIQEAS